jgi:hypothetical protein
MARKGKSVEILDTRSTRRLPLLNHKHQKASSSSSINSKPPTGSGGGLNPLYPLSARNMNVPARVTLSFDDLNVNNIGGILSPKNQNNSKNNKYMKNNPNNPDEKNNPIQSNKNEGKSNENHEKAKFGGNFNHDKGFRDEYNDDDGGEKIKKEPSFLQSKLLYTLSIYIHICMHICISIYLSTDIHSIQFLYKVK